MPQLDALRAFAVGAVMYHHTLGAHSTVLWGKFGVRLFFVLSGFLITGILLRARESIAAGRSLTGALRTFYIRRFLRIFPLFYLVLFVTAALDVEGVRDAFVWHLTYTSNIYFARLGHFIGPSSPFWSLAVEEQFYLVWPWLVLLVPRRALPVVLIAAVVIGPVYRVMALELQLLDGTTQILTPAVLDSLGLGALLAWARHERGAGGSAVERAIRLGAWLALPMLIVAHLTGAAHRVELAYTAFHDLIGAVFYAGVVAAASRGVRGPLARLLESAPLLYLGRISYGLYVYHHFIGDGLLHAWSRHLTGAPPPVANFALFAAITVGVAATSWQFFERPLNDLKKRFRY